MSTSTRTRDDAGSTVSTGRRVTVTADHLLATVVVVLLAVGGWAWVSDDDDLDAEVTSAASQAARDFFTLDHRTADEDVARMQASTTGDFSDTYAERSRELVTEVTGKKLVMTAEVAEDGVATEYLGDGEAQVLVAVDVATTIDSGATDEARYRTRVRLVEVDGAWLVAGLEQVG
ncbi:MAG: hypothetical protein CMH83_09615 [Nocardioides sp.]|nr:hypothetical protein [Nocardioides sp.]